MYPKSFFERTPVEPEDGQCFVLMPFAGRFQKVYRTIVEALESPELNFSCKRADELFGGGHIIEDMLQNIGNAEIIIADVTSKNPNVFYELGITHMVREIEKVLILTQTMDDVPFDLRHFRCIVYKPSSVGLAQLKETLIATVKEIAKAYYRFSIGQEYHRYKFPHGLLGYDRYFYSFEMSRVWLSPGSAAKFYLTEYVHRIGQPDGIMGEREYGLKCGEGIALTGAPWRLVLERVDYEAHFRVVPIK